MKSSLLIRFLNANLIPDYTSSQKSIFLLLQRMYYLCQISNIFININLLIGFFVLFSRYNYIHI